MATFLGASPAILAAPVGKPHVSCVQSSRPPSSQLPNGEQQPQSVEARPQAAPTAMMKRADSTGWAASSTSLTRRFGIGAGLAWAGFLAVGVVSEQLKTRFDVVQPQQANTKDVEEQEREVVLPNGIRYYELRVGRGDVPRPGDLAVIDLRGRVAGIGGGGAEFVDTFGEGKRSLALVVGSRPYARGVCEGIEHVLRSMKAGGKRRVVVPPSLGFGDGGADFGEGGARIPPGATLEYVVQVDEASVAPA